jgi:hypothetical protein
MQSLPSTGSPARQQFYAVRARAMAISTANGIELKISFSLDYFPLKRDRISRD